MMIHQLPAGPPNHRDNQLVPHCLSAVTITRPNQHGLLYTARVCEERDGEATTSWVGANSLMSAVVMHRHLKSGLAQHASQEQSKGRAGSKGTASGQPPRQRRHVRYLETDIFDSFKLCGGRVNARKIFHKKPQSKSMSNGCGGAPPAARCSSSNSVATCSAWRRSSSDSPGILPSRPLE